MGGLLQCRYLLNRFKEWYERKVLGCSMERVRRIGSEKALNEWLDESRFHRESDLGFYVRIARQIGLNTLGRGYGNFISYGLHELPRGTEVRPRQEGNHLVPCGFARGIQVSGFKQEYIAEHVSHSWFKDYEGGKHPFQGETQPYATGEEGTKYSWSKAPRYAGTPAETGPLAEMVIGAHPLFVDMVGREGPNAFVRELARLLRPVELIPAMEQWFNELSEEARFYVAPQEISDGRGFGLIESTRGALGHWVSVSDGKIDRYQIITPTAWNASPRDNSGLRGPCEEALVGTPVKDPSNPVEVGHVVRSFDPCLVCTVHLIDGK
jgi:hydrogenase large subunit